MSEYNKEFGVRLKALLKTEGVKQVELAAMLGLTHAAVTNYIYGRVPDAATLTRIAEQFGVTVDYLLTGRSPWDERMIVGGRRIAEDSARGRIMLELADVDDATVAKVRAILDIVRAEAGVRSSEQGGDASPPRHKRRAGGRKK